MEQDDIDRIVAREREEAYTQGYVDGLEFARRAIAQGHEPAPNPFFVPTEEGARAC